MSLDKFKEYVKEHPRLKDDVLSKKYSWQEIYETWSLSDDDPFSDYKVKTIEEKKVETKTKDTEDMLKNVMGYVKKINPDNITKYVTSIQKVLELLASFGAGATAASATKKNTRDPLFDRRYDDWY